MLTNVWTIEQSVSVKMDQELLAKVNYFVKSIEQTEKNVKNLNKKGKVIKITFKEAPSSVNMTLRMWLEKCNSVANDIVMHFCTTVKGVIIFNVKLPTE